MVSATQPLFRRLRRLALTTKQVNGGYYKGNRTGSVGTHTKYGTYKVDWSKVRTYVVPIGLKDFNLTPFVTKKMRPTRGRFEGDSKGGLSGQRYLDRWKTENGDD
ncbi:MAG: hypothetical protein M4579_000863 [Chaenotheca gracillima]|nr:MAG: hypothetical protein M4579_000863 [Chaenotheca gracillima]